jgi:hypothetical protein
MPRKLVGRVLLLSGLTACGGHSQEAKVNPKVATDTLVERKQVVDTMVVKTDTTIASDTSRVGGGVTKVDTVQAGAVDSTRHQ